MDPDVRLLREVAAELRAVAGLVADRHGALPLAIRMAGDQATWQGRFAEGFANELRMHQGNLHNAQDGLVRLGSWLERVASEREAAMRMGPHPILPETR